MLNPRREKRLLDINGAEDLEKLRSIREREQIRLTSESSASQVNSVMLKLNDLHDALISRALKLAEFEMARTGHGTPPVSYAYMLYGSAGRYEQTMYSDQDSGLVYANVMDELEAERCRDYFHKFSMCAVRYLKLLGYPPCEGNVLASNPEWCMSLRDWENRIDGWFADSSWENVRYLLIAADARSVYGEVALVAMLRDRLFDDMLQHPEIEQRMLENTIRHKVLIGVFGQLLTERYGENAGSLDIKYGAYIPMVNAFRLFAIQAGIRETSTIRRIQALLMANLLTEEEAGEATDAFFFLLQLRLQSTGENAEGQLVGTGKIPAELLKKGLKAPLKKALRTGKKIQSKVQRLLQNRIN